METTNARKWVDPLPFEVERPRLPWYFNLPGKWVKVIFPIVFVFACVHFVVLMTRQAYKYPVISLSAVTVAWGCLIMPWKLVVCIVLTLIVLSVYWWRLHQPSFYAWVGSRFLSDWHRATYYAPLWRRVMRMSNLDIRVGNTNFYPKLISVRSEGWRTRLKVKMLFGQSVEDYEAKADEIANAYDATSSRIRVIRARRIAIDLVHQDTLRETIPFVAPNEYAQVDLSNLYVGEIESGVPWYLRLLGNHILIAGATGAGKASIAWSIMGAIFPLIRSGKCQVFGCDPKGGMEFGLASSLFHRLVYTNDESAVRLLEEVAEETKRRAEMFRMRGLRKWTPDCGLPFIVLMIDELGDIIAYQVDRKLRERANLALQTIISQGRAPGVCVIAQLQDPRKEIVSFRSLFPTRVCLRVNESLQVDMTLGEGMKARGADATKISETTPGVAWVTIDGIREPQRVRATYVTDEDLIALDFASRGVIEGEWDYSVQVPTQRS